MYHDAFIIEPETPADVQPIDDLLRAVFPQPAEADLVRALRAAGDIQSSFVARYQQDLIGVAVFSRVGLQTPSGFIEGTILAPVAVAAAHQQRGVGSRLIRDGLQQLEQSGLAFAVVLGEPEYYQRFGFTVDSAARIFSQWNGPYWQARIWQDDVVPKMPTMMCYPAAFDALG